MRKSLPVLKWFLPAALLIVASCRTLPEGPHPEIVDWMPPESDIIARLIVPGNQALINMIVGKAGVDPVKIAKISGRTALVAFGLEFGEGGEAASVQDIPVHAAVIGRWPKNLLGTSLGKDWKKSVFHTRRYIGPGGLELTVLSNNELILSRGRSDLILDRIREGSRSPMMERGIDLMQGADLALWLTDPAPVTERVSILPAANPDGTPAIEMIGLALSRREDGTYSLFFVIYPTDDKLSGSIALLLRIGLASRLGMSQIPEERALMPGLLVEVGSGEVRLILPSVSLDLLGGFLDDLGLFSGAGE